jgi:hypothetical protein
VRVKGTRERRFGSGVEWAIETQGNEDQFTTMLTVHRDGVTIGGSGMAGPRCRTAASSAPATASLTTSLAPRVIRTHPSLDRVVVMTDRRSRLDIYLTQPRMQFGLRFDAVELPADHLPVELHAESGGSDLARQTQGGLR